MTDRTKDGDRKSRAERRLSYSTYRRAGATQADAARRAGVSRSTAFRIDRVKGFANERKPPTPPAWATPPAAANTPTQVEPAEPLDDAARAQSMRASLEGVFDETTLDVMFPEDAEGETTSRVDVDDDLRPPRREETKPDDDDNVQAPASSGAFGLGDLVLPAGYGEMVKVPGGHPVNFAESWMHGHGRKIHVLPATEHEMASWGGR